MSSRAPSASSDSSSSPSPVPSPISPLFPRLPPLFAELTFFLVPAHLPPETDERITALGGERVGDARAARIVITALRGRPRLERILGAGATAMTNLLSDAFVADTYALAKLHEREVVSLALPDREKYRVFKHSNSVEAIKPPPSPTSPAPPTTSKPDIAPYPEDIPLRSIPRMAVERPCPLKCVNQDIVDAIRPIYALREFEEGAQKNSNVLSYRRSMSILKSVPRRLRSGAEARKLVDVGEKVANRIDEYLDTGTIAESDAILASEHYRALVEFSSIHGVGTVTAAELWERGCRTLDDVKAYYCDGDGKEENTEHSETGGRKRKRKRETESEHRAERHAFRRRMEGTMSRSEVVCAWLDLKDELAAPIPRAEAEEIAAVVAQNAEALHPACVWTIAGGYRRGKPEVSDVDVILSPAGDDPDLLGALCRRLGRLGIVTHVLQKTVRDPNTPLHSSGANFDNLDKAFVILRLPPAEGNKNSAGKRPPPRLHRRVDIILAPRERYAAAVLSWSGSMMFERDLRRVAEDQGYKFRAGLLSRTNEEIHFGTEREILAFLGLAYVPPELRNADG